MKKYLSGLFKRSVQYLLIVLAMTALFSVPVRADDSLFELCKKGTIADISKALESGREINEPDEKKRTPLMGAAWENTPEVVSFLIQRGASIHEKNEYGLSPLWYAVLNKNIEVAKLLLKAGASIGGTDTDGYTLLMSAARECSNSEIIPVLIAAGSSVREHSEKGVTPLMAASGFNENADVVRKLLKAGASVNERNVDGMTPLICAAIKAKNPEIVQILIKAGASIKDRDINKSTALMAAAAVNSNRAVLHELILAGAGLNDVAGENTTPLMFAAANTKNPDIIIDLLSAGADGTIQNANGMTAFDHAATNKAVIGTPAWGALKKAQRKNYGYSPTGKESEVAVLDPLFTGHFIAKTSIKEINDDPSIDHAEFGTIYSDWAEICSGEEKNVVGFNKIFASRNSDGELQYQIVCTNDLVFTLAYVDSCKMYLLNWSAKGQKQSPLFLEKDSSDQVSPDVFSKTCETGTFSDVQKAISKGASVIALDSANLTPLMVAAAAAADPKIIDVLLEAGAYVEEKTHEGFTPLIIAARYNKNPRVLERLISKGASLEVCDKTDGMTPLMHAAYCNPNPDTILCLLKAGANGRSISQDGSTVYDIAQKNNAIIQNLNVMEALKKAASK